MVGFLSLLLATCFEVSFGPAPDGAEEAFTFATRTWSRIVESEVPIRVRVSFTDLPSKAVTVPNGAIDFDGAPLRGTWYPAALADAITGLDNNPGQNDMEIFFNRSVPWYFGTDGDAPRDRVDFVTVALHEIAHGLGMTSLLRVEGDHAYYGLRANRASPRVTFPMPEIAGRPTIFDRFIETPSGDRPSEAGLPGRRWRPGHALKEGRLLFGGRAAVRRNGGSRPWLQPTSPSHFQRGRYDEGPDSLMTPVVIPGLSTHRPGPILLGVLEDIGWTLRRVPVQGRPRRPPQVPADPDEGPMLRAGEHYQEFRTDSIGVRLRD